MTRISSTYTKKITKIEPLLKINIEVSDLEGLNPHYKRHELNFRNHSQGLYFKPYKVFLQFANIIRSIHINKTRWLDHIYILMKISIKKHIMHIYLLNHPIKLHNKRQNDPNSSRFNDRTKNFKPSGEVEWY